MRFMRLWWLPFAATALSILFIYSSTMNWSVGLVWGGKAVILASETLSFLPIDITHGHFLGAVFIVFGLFQFLIWGLYLDAYRSGETSLAVALLFACVGLTCFSAYTAIAYHSATTDLTFREADVRTARWGNTTVSLERLYKKTQTIAPRNSEIIKAEISQLLNTGIIYNGRKRRLGKVTKACKRGTYKLCKKYHALKRELAESLSYQDDQQAIKLNERAQQSLLVIDPNAYFALFDQLTGVQAAKQKIGRVLTQQFFIELFTIFGLGFIKLGIRKSILPHGPEGPNKQHLVVESVDESVIESDLSPQKHTPKLTVIKGGASPPEQSLVDYMHCVGATDWMRTEPFMQAYKSWCRSRGLKPIGRNFVGRYLGQYGGAKRFIYIPTNSGKQSRRVEWRIGIVAEAA